MATFTVNQVRDIVITSAEAAESTASTFVSSASNGESRVLKSDGSGVPTAKGDFYIISKRSNGDVKRSDVIKQDKVTYLKKQAPVTAVAKSISMAIPSGIATGTILRIDITLDQWGSASFEDQYFKFGVYKVVAGDTVEDIADGLIRSLARNFQREEPLERGTDSVNTYAVVTTATGADDAAAQTAAFALIAAGTIEANDNIRVTGDTIDKVYTLANAGGANFAAAFTEVADWSTYTVRANPYFTFDKTAVKGGTYSLTITEKDQQFVLGKEQARHLVFSVRNDFNAIQTETARTVNPNSGRRIADLEWFCMGFYGDMYRGAGWPYDFDSVVVRDADAAEATGYFTVEIGFFYEGGNHAVQKSEKQLTIASTDKAAINNLITDIAAGTGLTLAQFP